MVPPVVVVGWRRATGHGRPRWPGSGPVQYNAGGGRVKGQGLALLAALLLLVFSGNAVEAQDRAGRVRLGELEATLSQLVAVAQAKQPVTGADPETVGRLEAELDAVRMQYAQARAAGRETERAALEEAVQKKSAELQAAYATNWRAIVERNRWRSHDVRQAALIGLLTTYGREQGLALIVDQATGKEVFRREGWAGQVSDDAFEDLTEPVAVWLRERVGGQRRPSSEPPG
ncbi:MAG: hypothetical protein K8G79_00600 [bacterium]|uniref:Uncharacterized protein n=1 Tax=Candidatus Methylomirabilis tolerans TaxID=3123416 RepID=A0AAJ1AFX1_9BACT|nr:hypothetical protein [Candidatus Methylomirabilis sp.]